MAGDADDLSVISAMLQDAIGKIGDFAYLPDERRFAFIVNRFVWECAVDRQTGPFIRVRTAIHFDDVAAAQFQYLRTDARDAVLELLAIQFNAADDGAGDVILSFAGGGLIRLKVESVNAFVTDISDPWRTRSKPAHKD